MDLVTAVAGEHREVDAARLEGEERVEEAVGVESLELEEVSKSLLYVWLFQPLLSSE